MRKKKKLILRQRAARERKQEILNARRIKARQNLKKQMQGAKRRRKSKKKFLRDRMRQSRPPAEKKEVIGFFEDPNIQRSPAVQYFLGVIEHFKGLGIEMFPVERVK